MLPAAIERRLPLGTVRTRTPVLAIERDAAGWRVRTEDQTVGARALIVSVPATAAAGMLSAVDPRIAALCAEVPYVSSATVTLAWRREEVAHPLAGTGFVVARRYNSMRGSNQRVAVPN